MTPAPEAGAAAFQRLIAACHPGITEHLPPWILLRRRFNT